MAFKRSTSTVNSEDFDEVYQNSRLDKKYIMSIYQAFCENCPQGQMERHQFMESVFDIQHAGAHKFYDKLFNAVDKDDNKTLDFKEFMEALDVLMEGQLTEKFDLLFRMCDADKNGMVSQEELQEMILAILQLRPIDDLSQQEHICAMASMVSMTIMERFDTNKDGHLSKEELVKGCLDNEKIRHLLTHAFSKIVKSHCTD